MLGVAHHPCSASRPCLCAALTLTQHAFLYRYCPYCTKAKVALKSIGAVPFVLELDGRPDCDAVQQELKNVTGGSSVPRVFIAQKFFGGGDDTAAAAASGELAKLCA